MMFLSKILNSKYIIFLIIYLIM